MARALITGRPSATRVAPLTAARVVSVDGARSCRFRHGNAERATLAGEGNDAAPAVGVLRHPHIWHVGLHAVPGLLETLARGFRDAGVTNATTATVPDAGHFAQEEQPAEVWRIISGFARSTAA
ncbi:alpha/beta fold hydrolase [Actinomadura welshii]